MIAAMVGGMNASPIFSPMVLMEPKRFRTISRATSSAAVVIHTTFPYFFLTKNTSHGNRIIFRRNIHERSSDVCHSGMRRMHRNGMAVFVPRTTPRPEST